ncbi:MAG: phosphoglycerate mutase family protein [Litorimonas sp.]
MRLGRRISFTLCAALAFFTAPTLTACQAANVSASSASAKSTPVNIEHMPLKVFLVRHAEKTADKDDPALTQGGQERAALLSSMLKDAGITHIHSSDYQRTRDTAAPLATRLGLSVDIYDPRDLPAMAAKLQASGGRHLVVGHSNTTGALTELLGGHGGAPIVEASEYDRLYIVTRAADGSTNSTLLRFGE